MLLKQPHSLRPVWSSYIYCFHTPLHVSVFLIQQEEDQTNTKDNIPPMEEATERKPYGLRIF
jgi:hypothetical protein